MPSASSTRCWPAPRRSTPFLGIQTIEEIRLFGSVGLIGPSDEPADFGDIDLEVDVVPRDLTLPDVRIILDKIIADLPPSASSGFMRYLPPEGVALHREERRVKRALTADRAVVIAEREQTALLGAPSGLAYRHDGGRTTLAGPGWAPEDLIRSDNSRHVRHGKNAGSARSRSRAAVRPGHAGVDAAHAGTASRQHRHRGQAFRTAALPRGASGDAAGGPLSRRSTWGTPARSSLWLCRRIEASPRPTSMPHSGGWPKRSRRTCTSVFDWVATSASVPASPSSTMETMATKASSSARTSAAWSTSPPAAMTQRCFAQVLAFRPVLDGVRRHDKLALWRHEDLAPSCSLRGGSG